MNPSNVIDIRPLAASDQAALWEIFHVALWDPPPAPLRPREILRHPEVRIYAEDWGRADDIGVIACTPEGAPAGAAWMRLIREGRGLAYVDDETPQLGIGLFPPFQRQGHGTRLMAAALGAARAHGYRTVALTVHPENPAIGLYERAGFRGIGVRRTYIHMLKEL